jgi:hypothetical protein
LVAYRQCLVKYVIRGGKKIEGKRRPGRKCKHLLDDLDKKREWKLKKYVLVSTL